MNLRTILASLQTTSTSEAGKITLRQGQIFVGKVLKLFPNAQALVQLGGLRVQAKLEAPLEAGKSYWLQVTNATGTPQLKVLGKNDMRNQTNGDVGLFKNLGISSSHSRETLLRAFLKDHLPFSKETIEKGGEWMKTAYNEEEAVKVIKEMVKRQLPFKFSVFQSLLSGESAEPLNRQISSLLAQLRNVSDSEEWGKKLRELLPQLSVKATDSPEAFKQSLEKVIAELGLSYEHDLLQSDKKLEGSQQWLKQLLPQLLQKSNSPAFKQQVQEFLLLLNKESSISVAQFQKLMTPAFQEAIARLTNSNHQLTFSTGDLKGFNSLKPLLMQVIDQTDSNELKHNAKQLLGQITSQQLNSVGPFQTVVQFPLQTGQHESTATLKWEGKKDPKGQFDPDHCRILFNLDLENLRQTVVDVNIQKRFVTIRVYNEGHELKALIDQFEPALRKNLEGKGYHLSSIKQPKGEPDSLGASSMNTGLENGVDISI